MPTLCIPRRKSILIETIHHSRGPTDELLFLRSRRRAARTFMLGSLQLRTRVDRFGASLPRRPFVDPVSTEIQFYRISRNFDRTVGFGLSPRPRSVCPLSFFFGDPWNYAPQDSPAFAESRPDHDTTRGLFDRWYSFSLGLWNLWRASQISISPDSKSRDYETSNR